MARDRRDDKTMNLLDWEPPKVVVKVDDGVAGHGDLANQIARTISHALRECKKERKEVVELMSAYLGRNVSRDMLDKWSSEASDNHRIPLDAFIALVEATNVSDLLGFAPNLFGYAVIEERYRKIIELHEIEEHERKVALHRDQLKIKKASLLEQMRGE